MNTPPPTPRVISPMHADPSMAAGAYANSLVIWHTAHEFTLDFLVNNQPPQPAETPEGEQVIHVPRQIVARVRIAPGLIFEILRALNENMTNYERVFGPIQRPGTGQEAPLYPPPDLGDTGDEPPPP